MAIAVEMEFPGGTIEQYEQVIERMGYTRHGQGEPGGLFHWVAATDDGLRVVDVWESRERFEQFGAEKLGPVTQELGVPEPSMRFYEVHNYLTAGAAVPA